MSTTNLSLSKGRSKSKLGSDFDALADFLDARLGGVAAVTYSATPTFDCSTASTFQMTLTGNVTTLTVSNPSKGQTIVLEIAQDGSGAHTFAFPANFKGATAISGTASKTSVQAFRYDGTNWVALAAGYNF